MLFGKVEPAAACKLDKAKVEGEGGAQEGQLEEMERLFTCSKYTLLAQSRHVKQSA